MTTSPFLLSRSASPTYDLLVKGGRLVDPSQGISANKDVAIQNHVIAQVAEGISESEAHKVVDAKGKIVTPGLIDIHVHVYDGVAGVGIWPDVACVARGATTVLDAGSAGATTFPGFRRYVIERAKTRVYALLNLSSIGLASLDELPDMSYADWKRAIEVIDANRDVILGVKVRMTPAIVDSQDLAALRIARRVVDRARLPLMVHIGSSFSPLKEILALMRKGDVITHAFRAKGSVLDDRGHVLPEVLEASARGVRFDVGHGSGNFSFDTAEKAIGQGFLPDTISSDIHSRNFNGPVFDLATTLSKFLYLGLTLEQVIERATSNPSRIFPFKETIGTLREGAEADLAVFDLFEGKIDLMDSSGKTRTGHQKLIPVATVKGGRVYA